MALAIRFDRLIKEGEITDQADLARLGNVTRARVTQIMNLLQLAPEIQEDILFLPRTVKGRDPIREHHLRPIVAEPDWRRQRRRWKRLAFYTQTDLGDLCVEDVSIHIEQLQHSRTDHARLQLPDTDHSAICD
jgi:hypothetical protein